MDPSHTCGVNLCLRLYACVSYDYYPRIADSVDGGSGVSQALAAVADLSSALQTKADVAAVESTVSVSTARLRVAS